MLVKPKVSELKLEIFLDADKIRAFQRAGITSDGRILQAEGGGPDDVDLITEVVKGIQDVCRETEI